MHKQFFLRKKDPIRIYYFFKSKKYTIAYQYHTLKYIKKNLILVNLSLIIIIIIAFCECKGDNTREMTKFGWWKVGK